MSTVDILIPCKSFARGKSRLAGVLGATERERLCRAMFERTLAVARAVVRPGWRLAVTSDDARVRVMAEAAGALALADLGHDVNVAVTEGNAALMREAGLMVLPADLPLLKMSDFEALQPAEDGVTIVPDRHRTGTNALVLSPRARARFTVSFGPDSFRRHLAHAVELGFAVRVARPPGMVFDLDSPDDLASLPQAFGGRRLCHDRVFALTNFNATRDST